MFYSIQPQPTERPNDWHLRQMWRTLFEFEAGKGGAVRSAFVRLDFYPIGEIDSQVQFANERAALHNIINELTPEDTDALFHAARYLLLCPENGEVQRSQELKDKCLALELKLASLRAGSRRK